MVTLKINIATIQDYFTDIDSIIYEIKTEDVYEDFSRDKEMLNLVIIQLSQNTMINQKN